MAKNRVRADRSLVVFFKFFMIFLKNRKSDLEICPTVYDRLAGAHTIGRFARKSVTHGDRTLALLGVGLLTKKRRGCAAAQKLK